ncbi:ATP-NAD kinase-like domain-containing protein [Coniochaeta hoffmannii]|uniref:ATP-NAD kinase-like domain-containing protein n=1 Tax=Coniochaeta hoffmannii TaxID=91930 RepID=A0AA38RXM4_9PEZI|nr:ATP-NAD kinase-like domain-containing protein [Coniochaeta hoffmannii]
MCFAVPPGGFSNEPLNDFQMIKFLRYENGELLLGLEDGDSDEPAGRLKEASIIAIYRENARGGLDSEGEYYIYSLVEDAPDTPFKVLTSHVVNQLPRDILDKYLITSIPDHLKCDATHRLTVVVSTHSGVHQAEAFYNCVLKGLLGQSGLKEATEWSPDRDQDKYELILTKSDQTVRDLGKQLSNPSTTGQARTIVLLSGDGGVVDLINGEDEADGVPSGRRPTIILLPFGTGNALFHSLHKPLYASSTIAQSPYVLGLRTLLRGVPAPLPTFEATFAPGSRLISYSDGDQEEGGEEEEEEEEQRRSVSRLAGAIVASYGFHASLVWESDTPAYRKHGAARFQMAAGELLGLGHGYEADVEVRAPGGPGGAGEWTRLGGGEGDRFGYVLATLVSSLEKTFTISPDSRPLDGKLRLVTFGDVGGERTMDVMKAAYDNGGHVGMKWAGEGGREERVGYQEVEEVRVTVREEDARWRKVCVDGTIVEVPGRGGWMRVRTVPESRYDVIVDKSVV